MILNWRRFRQSCRWFHRWVGLTLGLVFVFYGLTGSYIVFMDEIEAWIDPSMKHSQSSSHDISLAELARIAQLPEGALRIRMPEDPTRNIEFLFNREKHLRVTEYIDPALKEHVGQRKWSSSLTGILYSFHHDLFLGDPGKRVTAIQASVIFMMLLVGLWLWLPRRGQRAAALTPQALKHARGTLRTHLELHKFVGIYVFLLLLMAVGSGIFIAQTQWFLAMSKPSPLPAGSVTYAIIDDAIRTTGLSPRGNQIRIRDESVTLTRNDGSAYLLDITSNRFVPRTHAESSNRIYDFIRDIHGGRYWGRYGAGVTFIIGLLPLLFYITGFVIWQKKRAHKRAALTRKQEQA